MRYGSVCLAVICGMLLTACSTASESATGECSASGAQADHRMLCWHDAFASDDGIWVGDFESQFTLDEFPDVAFIWKDSTVYRAGQNETVPLVGGMPIQNVYFCDLNGDGYRELCATVNFGSGIVDCHIAVYDLHNDTAYELSDRMEYDYMLCAEDGALQVRKSPYITGNTEADEIGMLRLADGALSFETTV